MKSEKVINKRIKKIEEELIVLKTNLNDEEPFNNVRLKDMVSKVSVCLDCGKVIRKHAKNIKPIEWGGDERCECDRPSTINSEAYTNLLLMLWDKDIRIWDLK